MFEQRFPQKRAFVTGGASGLGLEICEQLAKDGWRILVADIDAKSLAELENRLNAMGGTAISMVLNVSSQDDLDAAASRVKQEWDGIDLVFNNAGVGGAGEFEAIPLDEWQRIIDIDLWGVIYGCRSFIPMMKEQNGGYIINTASSAGTLSLAQMANYNVAKAGVVSLSETIKVELSPFNIGVSVICPTVFNSNISSSMKSGTSFEKNLEEQIVTSKFMPSHVVDATFKSMLKNKLYVIPQADGRWGRRIKRLFPEFYLTLMSYCYKKRFWLYKYL